MSNETEAKPFEKQETTPDTEPQPNDEASSAGVVVTGWEVYQDIDGFVRGME